MPTPLPPRQHRFPAGTLLLLKGGPIANKPGLSLQRVTDKAGNPTQRWEKSNPDQPGQGKPPAAAPMKHGDTIRFRHGDVEGRGRITASGADGVTVQSEDGATHQIRHEHIQGREPTRPKYPDRMAGEEDKPYLKRIKGELPDPDHLPEEHDRYFNMGPKTQTVPMDQLVSTKSAEENEKGGNNSPKFMAAAYHGVVSKRDPISVRKREDGKYEVTDGNGTLTGVQKHGWKGLPVNVEDGEGKPGEGGAGGAGGGGGELGPDVQPLFQAAQVANLPKSCGQPTSDKEELFAKSGEALESLKDWLNKGKGLCSQMGHQTMTVSPGEADFSQPGGMLFIAPLKGQDRAAQKVAQDYGGDWSKLIDTVRCTIAVDSHEELPGVVEKLMSGGMKLARQPKDRFAKPIPCGYRDALLNITLPNGLVGEVQLHVKPMLQAKNDGHHHYEIERDIEPKIKQGTATNEDMATLKKAQQDMKTLYVEAWHKAAGGAGGDAPDPMAKAFVGGRNKGKMPMSKDTETAARYTYLDHDNAQYRRKENGITRGVDDVLVNGEWKPYGGDALEPGLYGDEIPDPLGGGESMTKSLFIVRKG